MKIREIVLVLRKDGFFHYKGRRIQAARPGEGWGVMVILEPSQIDVDFGCRVWVPSADELEQIRKALDKSDELTHRLLGHGWGGKQTFFKLYEFM